MAEPAPVVLKFPLGADNRSREHELPDGALRVADNLDISARGGLRCRDGLRRLETWDCHSLYPHPAGGYLLVHDGALWRVLGGAAASLVGVAQDRKVRYATHNDEVFWTNGAETGRVTRAGEASFWGLNPPPLPVVTAVSGGETWASGTYQITATAVIDGIESGAPDPVSVAVTAPDGLWVTTPPAAAGIAFNVYVSTPHGGSRELRRALSGVAAGTTVAMPPERGARLQSLLAVKPYPGQLIASYRGRLWWADGSTVWFTDAASPHWLFPEEAFYSWADPITLLVPVLDGLYIGTAAATWLLQGDGPANMTLRRVADWGAVLGTGTNRVPYDIFGGDGTPCAVWLDTGGVLCCGRSGGIVQRITEARYRIGTASTGEIVFRMQGGIRQLLVILDGWAASTDIARDTSVSEFH